MQCTLGLILFHIACIKSRRADRTKACHIVLFPKNLRLVPRKAIVSVLTLQAIESWTLAIFIVVCRGQQLDGSWLGGWGGY